MARTGYASAAAISGCSIARPPCDRTQVLPAYGLQDLRNKHQDPKTKSNPNTMCLPITPGENRGSRHFYLAKNRTFLLCVDTHVQRSRTQDAPEKNPGLITASVFELVEIFQKIHERTRTCQAGAEALRVENACNNPKMPKDS